MFHLLLLLLLAQNTTIKLCRSICCSWPMKQVKLFNLRGGNRLLSRRIRPTSDGTENKQAGERLEKMRRKNSVNLKYPSSASASSSFHSSSDVGRLMTVKIVKLVLFLGRSIH